MHSGRQPFLQMHGLLRFPLARLFQASDGEASQVLGDFKDLRWGVLNAGVSGGPLGGNGVLGSLPATGCQDSVCAFEELTVPARARVVVTRQLAVPRYGLVASLEPPTLGRHEAPGFGVAAGAHFPATAFSRRLHLDVVAVNKQVRGPLPGGLLGGPSAGVRWFLPGSGGRVHPRLPDSHFRTRFYIQCAVLASDTSLPASRSPGAAACSAPLILKGGHFEAPGGELACSRLWSDSGRRRVAPAPV